MHGAGRRQARAGGSRRETTIRAAADLAAESEGIMITKRMAIEYIANRLIELHQDPDYSNPSKHCNMLRRVYDECMDYCKVGQRFSQSTFAELWEKGIDLAIYKETGRQRLF